MPVNRRRLAVVRRLAARNTCDSLRVTIQTSACGTDHHGDGDPFSIMANYRAIACSACHAVFSALSPSFLIVSSRITNFWILPVMVIGNSATNSM
jgi:hypothetical protein